MDSPRKENPQKHSDTPRGNVCLFLVVLSSVVFDIAAQDRIGRKVPEMSPEIQQNRKLVFKPFVYNPPPDVAAAALLAVFDDSKDDPLSGDILINDYVTRNDVSVIKDQIKKLKISMKVPNPIFKRPTYVYDINGWKCDGGTARFHRIFTLEQGRSANLSGDFFQSSDGHWKARVTRLRRLLTRPEVANIGGRNAAGDKFVELVPTPEEARIAVAQWVKSLRSYSEKDEAASDFFFTQVVPILELPGSLEALVHDQPGLQENKNITNSWNIGVHEMMFTKVITFPLETTISPMLLTGQLRLTPRGVWEATATSISPLNHR